MARQFAWLFFGFSGRIGRRTYALAAALSYIARMLPFYQFLRHPVETPQSDFWAMIFLTALVVSLWMNVALTVKRLHDADKPGALALITIVLDLLAVIAFALVRGTPGPNRYGAASDEPR